MSKKKFLVFDMDGTLVDLYHVNNWFEFLKAENPKPYQIAEPLYDMRVLKLLLETLKLQGWQIIVTSWLAKESSKEYDNLVTKNKLEWLKKYSFPYDEIYIVPYGTNKTECTCKKGGYQILIDDNQQVRDNWDLGNSFDANLNVIEFLRTLLEF